MDPNMAPLTLTCSKFQTLMIICMYLPTSNSTIPVTTVVHHLPRISFLLFGSPPLFLPSLESHGIDSSLSQKRWRPSRGSLQGLHAPDLRLRHVRHCRRFRRRAGCGLWSS